MHAILKNNLSKKLWKLPKAETWFVLNFFEKKNAILTGFKDFIRF